MTRGTYQLLNCDVFDGLQRLTPKSVHCVVSSPPYLGLRDYGIPPRKWADGSECVFGLESSVASYVTHTVELFAELGRVLRDDGVIWWNIGDSYSQYNANRGKSTSVSANIEEALPSADRGLTDARFGCGQKMLIPHRVAIALQDAGWIVRQDVVWAKKSPMPESLAGWQWKRCRVKTANGVESGPTKQGDHENRQVAGFNERYKGGGHAKWHPCPGCPKCSPNGGYVLRRGSWRPTTGHEFIFQIVKGGDYFGDGEAAQEISSTSCGGEHHRINGKKTSAVRKKAIEVPPESKPHSDFDRQSETRNPRSVWSLSSESYKQAHFATFPTELVRRCLVGSCSKGGCCPACGSQYAPVVEKERVATRPALNPKVWKHADGDEVGQRSAASPNLDPERHIQRTNVLGYRPTCSCNAGEPIPPTVLEPFSGSGTTLQVATWMGFNAIGFELNLAYIELAKVRIETMPRCLMPKKAKAKRRVEVAAQRVLDFGT